MNPPLKISTTFKATISLFFLNRLLNISSHLRIDDRIDRELDYNTPLTLCNI